MTKQFSPDRDWLTAYLPHWDRLLVDLADGGRALEVGTYEGRAAVHLLYAYPAITLDIVDNFVDLYGEGFEARFDHNLAEYEGRFRKIKAPTTEALPRLLQEGERYNFIYLDADHTYEACKHDLAYCWEMLLPGGTLFLDDYNDHLRQNPFKFGVDSAVNEFFIARQDYEFELLSNIHTDYQFYVRKL